MGVPVAYFRGSPHRVSGVLATWSIHFPHRVWGISQPIVGAPSHVLPGPTACFEGLAADWGKEKGEGFLIVGGSTNGISQENQ